MSTHIVPIMCRCADCQAWASVKTLADVESARCGGCGGVMLVVDMEEHRKTLPVGQADPAEAERARAAAEAAKKAAK